MFVVLYSVLFSVQFVYQWRARWSFPNQCTEAKSVGCGMGDSVTINIPLQNHVLVWLNRLSAIVCQGSLTRTGVYLLIYQKFEGANESKWGKPHSPVRRYDTTLVCLPNAHRIYRGYRWNYQGRCVTRNNRPDCFLVTVVIIFVCGGEGERKTKIYSWINSLRLNTP